MKIIFSILFALTTAHSFAQTSKIQDNSKSENNTFAYRLFPTQNMWTFIKLNTRNGLMWQVQFDVQGSNRLVSILNSEQLVSGEGEADNRFTLYATENIYTFILLDQLEGRTWQVQWSTDVEHRGMVPIE